MKVIETYHGAPAFSVGFHGQEHRPHRGVPNNGVRNAALVLSSAQGAHRVAVLAVPQGVLEREFGGGNALHGRAHPAGVDEGKPEVGKKGGVGFKVHTR